MVTSIAVPEPQAPQVAVNAPGCAHLDEFLRAKIIRRMRREITEIVLQREDNAARFEKFCAEACEKAEGQTFLTTSRSFDQARDAVALGRSKGSHPAIILCTLEKNIKRKLTADIEKLAKTSTPDRLVYCWNQRLSQLSSDGLVAIIRKRFPRSSVAVYGVEELASFAEKTSPIFETHYRAELDSITRVKDASAVETKGLSLALAALGSDDAKKLRSEVSTAAVLVILTAHANLNLADIARELTTLLNLPKGLDTEYIRAITNECVASGLIEEKGGIWSLRVAGLEKAAALSTQAADQLLTGRILIRQRLETSIGRKLDDRQYEIIWSTLQDFFAELFYSNGLATICAVNEILSDAASGSGDKVNLRKLVADGAARVGHICADPQSKDELERAVLDIFTERTGTAFDWLARVAERFVALCSLGLETTSAAEIRKILGRYQLTLDTDIVLTYLCGGEADHDAAKELMNRWLGITGEVALAPTVLQEVANHAWIATRHFVSTVHLLGKLEQDELPYYTDNAFVRAFHAEAKSEKDRVRWQSYIDQFRGKSAEDYSNVLEILADELRVTVLSEKFDVDLAGKISKSLQDQLLKGKKKQQRIAELTSEEAGKTKRDGELLATIAAARDANRHAGVEKTVVAISSSGRLRRAYEEFRPKLGNPDAVLSLGALSYLLSMLPENPLGAGSLRRALFDFTLKAGSTAAQQLAMQIIKAAGTIEIPLARRVTLRRALEKSIRTEAERRGMKTSVLESQFVRHNPSVPYSEIIGSAVKQMAAPSPQLAQRDARIRELERKIDELEEKERTARARARA